MTAPRTFASLRPSPEREISEEELHLNACFAKVFSGAEGDIVLKHLHQTSTFRVLGPDASDGALRHNEGRRDLVREIEGRIASGRRNADRQSKRNAG